MQHLLGVFYRLQKKRQVIYFKVRKINLEARRQKIDLWSSKKCWRDHQFYIQLLYKPHFGTWIVPFGLLGSTVDSKWKNSETTEFLPKYATFWGGFFMFSWAKNYFLICFYVCTKYTRVLLYWAEREYLQTKRLLKSSSHFLISDLVGHLVIFIKISLEPPILKIDDFT